MFCVISPSLAWLLLYTFLIYLCLHRVNILSLAQSGLPTEQHQRMCTIWNRLFYHSHPFSSLKRRHITRLLTHIHSQSDNASTDCCVHFSLVNDIVSDDCMPSHLFLPSQIDTPLATIDRCTRSTGQVLRNGQVCNYIPAIWMGATYWGLIWWRNDKPVCVKVLWLLVPRHICAMYDHTKNGFFHNHRLCGTFFAILQPEIASCENYDITIQKYGIECQRKRHILMSLWH